MKKPDLHKFEEDLTKKPADGSDAPPRTIRAKNLDENNVKLTLIDNPNEAFVTDAKKSYKVAYSKDGTYLSRILPSGSNEGDLLYWDGERWVVLEAIQNSTLHILGIKDSTLQWVETQDCP